MTLTHYLECLTRSEEWGGSKCPPFDFVLLSLNQRQLHGLFFKYVIKYIQAISCAQLRGFSTFSLGELMDFMKGLISKDE